MIHWFVSALFGATSPILPPISIQAQALYRQRCAMCHGASGKGNGHAGRGLTPSPTNFTDPHWQRSRSNRELARIIVEGGAALNASPLMPGNLDLRQQPQLVQALIALIRRFK